MSLRYASPLSLLFVLLLAGCKPADKTPEEPAGTLVSAETPAEEPVSILRPDVEAETVVEDEAPTQSLNATIGFPEGGSDLDADALAQLEQVRASAQFGASGAIILRSHSDSAGSDAVNERASQARGLVVAEWLIAAGADPRRIDVIVFGEQNPVQPNALEDGSPNEEGRAVNRRVEVEILAVASTEPAPADPEVPSDGAPDATPVAPSKSGDES